MQAGIAAPICLLDECAAQSHAHVALTHLIEQSREYREFYKKMSRRGDLVTVDNSVVEEDKAVDLGRLFAAAAVVEAQEIILPDVIGSGAKTIQSVTNALLAIGNMQNVPPYKLMAVAHGRNPTDWLMSYLFLRGLSQIHTIGLTMFMESATMGMGIKRIHIFWDLLKRWDLLSTTHDYHCLGCWEDVEEFSSLDKSGAIRSADTGMPVRMGLKGYSIGRFSMAWVYKPLKPEHRSFDFFADYQMNQLVQDNIDYYKNMCGDHS